MARLTEYSLKIIYKFFYLTLVLKDFCYNTETSTTHYEKRDEKTFRIEILTSYPIKKIFIRIFSKISEMIECFQKIFIIFKISKCAK